MLALHSNPRTLTCQRRAMASKIVPFSKNGLSSSPGFIITKKMIQYYVLFVQNRTPKKTWYLPPRRKRHSLKEDFQTRKRHLINSKNMKLPSAIKRLLTTRSIFRCLMKIVECLQYLCRQGQEILGGTNDESNFVQLMNWMTLLCWNGFKRQRTSTPVTISRMRSSRLWPIKCKGIWSMM